MEKPEIGHVTGQVANEINNHAPVTFVANYSPPPPLPSPLVLELRDKMPPATHDALDWLMQHGHMSANELYSACRYKALVADGPTLRKSRLTWMDYLLAAGYLVPSTLLLLLCLLAMALDATLGVGVGVLPLTHNRLALLAMVAMLTFTIWVAVQVFVRPHLAANRAARVLGGRG